MLNGRMECKLKRHTDRDKSRKGDSKSKVKWNLYSSNNQPKLFQHHYFLQKKKTIVEGTKVLENNAATIVNSS